MSILELVAPSSPLSQGDLLCNIVLHITSANGEPKVLTKITNALILSRDCNVSNKGKIVVAAVSSVNLELSLLKDTANSREKNFQIIRDKIIAMRDGDESPDRFYLGSIPKESIRLTARLDEIFTVEIPKSQPELLEWVGTRRVARLSEQFLRALPVRLFGAFARIGFDDYQWFPTVDLELVVNCGRAYLSELDASACEKQADVHLHTTDPKRVKDLTSAQQKRDLFKLELESYIKELERRA